MVDFLSVFIALVVLFEIYFKHEIFCLIFTVHLYMIHHSSLKQHDYFQIQLLKRAVSKFKRKSLAGVQSVRESPERGDGERRNTAG